MSSDSIYTQALSNRTYLFTFFLHRQTTRNIKPYHGGLSWGLIILTKPNKKAAGLPQSVVDPPANFLNLARMAFAFFLPKNHRGGGDTVGVTANPVSDITQAIGGTPLVRLEGWDTPVPIYGKCEHMNPGGSVKDRLGLALIEDGERRGLLRPGATVVEATAGNTGIGLALVTGARGYRLVCVMPQKMSADKRQALTSLGAEVIVVPDAPLSSPDNFRNTADRLAGENGWFLADQFRNRANVEAHYRATGPEILKQLGRAPAAFVAGVGTGGTISGVGRFFKENSPATRIVLCDPVGSGLAQWVLTGEYGPDGRYAVEGIGSSRAPANLDPEVVDDSLTISDEDSFATARQLQKQGLLVGGSSGTAVAAALRLAREGKVEGPVVALLADSWDRYFSQPWMTEPQTTASHRK